MALIKLKNAAVLWLVTGTFAFYTMGCEEESSQTAKGEQVRDNKKTDKNKKSRSNDDEEEDTNNEDHGPRPEDESDDAMNQTEDAVKADDPVAPPAQPTPPMTTPGTTGTPPATPPAPSQEQQLKAMIDAGKLITTVNIDPTNPELDATAPATNWFTSAGKPIKLYVAVDATGAAIVPANVTARQIASGQVGAPTDAKFQNGGADVTTMHSALRVCNKSGRQMYLHAGAQSPFRHGSGGIADGACAQFLVERTANTAGQSYDHLAGSGSPITFEIIKVDPQGKIVP